MKYYYSERTGMVQVNDDSLIGFQSEEEALLTFYANLRNELATKIDKYQKDIDSIKIEIQKLDRKYGSLKNNCPEEFI